MNPIEEQKENELKENVNEEIPQEEVADQTTDNADEPVAEEKAEEETVTSVSDGRILLFTTKTCPNCKIVKDMMNRKNIGYQIIDAEENGELCDEFEVMQAPTLVILKDDQSYDKYANASNIIRYLNN